MPTEMAKFQKKDNQLSIVYECVASNSKPKLSEIHSIRLKPVHRLLLQFEQLSLIRGVLHQQTFKDDDEIQQLILPQQLCENVLKSLHDDNSHQGIQHVMNFLQDKVYWLSMFADTGCWLSQCKQCLISKGDYTEPKTQQGSLVAHQPLELLGMDFTKLMLQRG